MILYAIVLEMLTLRWIKRRGIWDKYVPLEQSQFDALVSFTHQHGVNYWMLTPHKVIPKLILEGNDFDNDTKVRNNFELCANIITYEVLEDILK